VHPPHKFQKAGGFGVGSHRDERQQRWSNSNKEDEYDKGQQADHSCGTDQCLGHAPR